MKKPQIIIVTGTPATGKTTIAKRLAKKQKAAYIDVNLVIKKYKLVDKYDKKLKTNIVDVKIIKDYQNKKQSIIIDSHLSHYLPKKYVDLCIVTKCSLKKLQQRLNKRKYHQQKIRENMDAEILDVCLLEAILNKHKVKVVTT